MNSRSRLLCSLIAAVLVFVAVPATAGATVFWADTGGDIGTARLDGSEVNRQAIDASNGSLANLARDTGHLYYTHSEPTYHQLGRMDLDGANRNKSLVPSMVGQGVAWGVAVDSNYVYWADSGRRSIGRSNLDGSDPNLDFIPLASPAYNVAVDGGHIYWSSGNSIGRANLDGTGVNQFFIGGQAPTGLAVDGTYIYWGNAAPHTIGRAKLDGTGVTQSLAGTSGSPDGVAVDSGHIYWTNSGAGSIGRSNLDGTSPTNTFITGINPFDVVVGPDPPNVSITSGPTGPTTNATPTFGFTADGGSTVTCSIDTGVASYGACTSGSTHTPASALPDGAYTFRVRATVAGAPPTVKTRTFTVDRTPAETNIDSGPSGLTSSSAASFGFSSEVGASFECRLDAAAFSACTSPQSYSGIADGPHTFTVRASDGLGNTDASPATRSFTVDTTAPDTTITSGPQGTTADVTFDFTSDDNGAFFLCRIDSGFWEGCSSPQPYPGLSDGPHTFAVRAIDLAGNTDASPATREFTVDATPPDTTITSGPQGETSNPNASFAFTSSESGSSFKCRLDSAPFGTCTSPTAYAGLATGAHTFEVIATDGIGNTDPTPASRSFTITAVTPPPQVIPDTDPPVISITKKPKAKIKTKKAKAKVAVSFSSEPGATFECRLDKAAFKPCRSPFRVMAKSKKGKKGAKHTISIRATDTSGNVGSPATVSFRVARKSVRRAHSR